MLFVLMGFSAMADVAIAGMAATYTRSTGEYALATIIGSSARGDDFFYMKYETEHHALWTVCSSQSNPVVVGVPQSGRGMGRILLCTFFGYRVLCASTAFSKHANPV